MTTGVTLRHGSIEHMKALDDRLEAYRRIADENGVNVGYSTGYWKTWYDRIAYFDCPCSFCTERKDE